MAIVVYEKRTCTTCRNLATLLAERGIDFERGGRPPNGDRAVLARPIDRVLEIL